MNFNRVVSSEHSIDKTTHVTLEMTDKEESSKQRQNTSVFVSQLSTDTTPEDLKEHFAKFGVIAQDLLTNEHKVKLYTAKDGKRTGDALVTYLRPESVTLAVSMADGSSLNGNVIKVEEAVFAKKEETKTDEVESKKRNITEEQKKIIAKRLKTLKRKVDDWDDSKVNQKWIRTVVLKRAFTLKELEEDPYAKEDIQMDIGDGCSEIGSVEDVVLFDQEPEGIVLVKFASEKDADACVEKMNGRYFGGQRLIVSKYNGEEFSRTEDKDKHNKHDNDDHKEVGDLDRLDEYIKNVEE